ncbi:2160_t:CDS:10, partial [Cetraspora pellucida]
YNRLACSGSSGVDQDHEKKITLRPGIYLLRVNVDLGLVIHWPELGCYEENAPSHKKKNMINLHRYLTKLTDHQICLISEPDLESFDWNVKEEDDDSDEETEGAGVDFEVLKSQEEKEDFIHYPGFKIHLPSEIKHEIDVDNADCPLPFIIESTFNQAFATVKKVRAKSKSIRTSKHISNKSEFHGIIKGHTLLIDRQMPMDNLKMLIELEFAELEGELLNGKIIENMFWNSLKAKYSIFEDFITMNKTNSSYMPIDVVSEILNDTDLKRIHEKYPKIKNKIDKALKITSENWVELRKLFKFVTQIIDTQLVVGEGSETAQYDNNRDEAIKELYNLLVDQDINFNKQVKKYFQEQKRKNQDNKILSLSWFKNLFSSDSDVNNIVSNVDAEINKKIKEKTDSQFIQDLHSYKFENADEIMKNRITSRFLDEYQGWRNDVFHSVMKKSIPQYSDRRKDINSRLEDESKANQKKINDSEFLKICEIIEKKQSEGYFIAYHVEEIQPEQLQYTIYNTSLDQNDILSLRQDELHVPNPTIELYHQNNCFSFLINPQTYKLRKMALFEKNKYFIALWNVNQSRLEIYYETLRRTLSNPIQLEEKSHLKPKIFHAEEQCLIAVNEPNGMFGIYQTGRGVLDVYMIDESQTFYMRARGVQICAWYCNRIPDIKFLFFIKDKEEICFVQTNGQARIFNLITNQFLPGTARFPINARDIVCTPDGSCIVSFVEENESNASENPLGENASEENPLGENASHESNEQDSESDISASDTASNSDTEDSTEQPTDTNKSVIKRAYIYFCSGFGRPASKVIQLPSIISTLEFIQFSCMENQIHLTTFDIHTGTFHSLIIRITHEKTQYSFQQKFNKRSLGKVRTVKNSSQNMELEGKDTSFIRDIKKGENLVIMGEKHIVLKIYSDTKLKVLGSFQCMIGIDSWMEFRIEPKTKLNGFVDAYKLMFEKYPIDNIIDSDQNHTLNLRIALDLRDDKKITNYENKFQEYVSDMFEDLKRSTNKPATSIKRFGLSCLSFSDFDLKDLIDELNDLKNNQLGEWIIQLCILIPIQIAVARNNIFQPVSDGLSSFDAEIADSGALSVDGIAQSISFGWYEGIFKYFGDKPVKVVSSMGEQYMLNHLIGTTFDGSAMRCTEGVWMSLAITKKCIYVALDFEGLNSLQRSPQEDMFLTLFNTVISNLILFKNQFAVNRDMSTMFQRFQDGATLLNDEKIFQAKLCIIIKDVPKQDRDGIVSEFSLRFRTMVMQEGENNFITKMYPGGLNINPWPMFNNPEWFKNLRDIKKMLDKQDAKYENARTFLQNTKVFMAKLKICDWGSLDENLVQIRVSTLKRLLNIAISLGIEEKNNTLEHLMNRDTGKIIPDQVINLTEIYDDVVDSCDLILDSDLCLLDENTDFVPLSTDLRIYFEDKVQNRKVCPKDAIWFEKLSKFFKFIVQRRINRVQEWFQQNTSKFSPDNSDVKDGIYALDQLVNKLSLLWTLCGLSCQECNLKCLKNRYHEDAHNCLTDHHCYVTCEFLEAHTNNLPPRCSHKAGHDGKHACNTTSHLCGKPCKFSDKRNCQQKCAKEIDHDDDEHICQSKRHNCGAPCSLQANTRKGFYKCLNKCIIPCEDEHERHCCENDSACPIQCPIPDCQRRCQSKDHFHALQSQQIHFCGNEHQCQEDCQELGICKLLLEPKKQEEVYQGLVQGTSITFTKYIQLSEKIKCCKKIPPNAFHHDGNHSHDEGGFHYCDAQSLHETKHGNMIKTEFTSEDKEFEYRGAGDQGTFVLCNLEFGRHRHMDYCQDTSTCKPSANKRHCDVSVEPHPERPKDYISHKLFWERTGFKVQEQEMFEKCDHECADEIHKPVKGSNVIPNRSFCELALFHTPLKLTDAPPNGIGYISLGGHHFTCDNPAKREGLFHIIFAIDRSGSMSSSDKKPQENTPVYNLIKDKHYNRTGAVYSAVYSFMEARLAAQVRSTNKDTVSLILFNSEVIVPFENQVLTDSKMMLNQMLPHLAGGGTNFNLAIQKAGSLINNYFDPARANVIIFLSDGGCSTPTGQLEQICKYNSDKGNPLYLITVLFAGGSDSSSLREMAEIAGRHHPANKIGNDLRCHFTSVMSEINLVNTFTSVAESLR